MRTTLDLSDDLIAEAKALGACERLTLIRLIIDGFLPPARIDALLPRVAERRLADLRQAREAGLGARLRQLAGCAEPWPSQPPGAVCSPNGAGSSSNTVCAKGFPGR